MSCVFCVFLFFHSLFLFPKPKRLSLACLAVKRTPLSAVCAALLLSFRRPAHAPVRLARSLVRSFYTFAREEARGRMRDRRGRVGREQSPDPPAPNCWTLEPNPSSPADVSCQVVVSALSIGSEQVRSRQITSDRLMTYLALAKMSR